jgi:hypothetical protein
MGVDSAAILTRWLTEPASRDFDLSDLIVLTAMTGDEYQVTEDQMNTHLLPLMRAHGVRFVQVSRAGQSDTDGIVVLSDSRTTEQMTMRGPWALSDEQTNNGLVPQIMSGARKCSYKAKGWVLDRWIADNIGQEFRHVIGFAAEEDKRAERDSSYTTNSRTPEYPLRAWGWDRAKCDAYLMVKHGVKWSRSCCGYCPFQAGRTGLPELMDRWRAEPDQAVKAIVMEHSALMLNPRSMLFGSRTARSVAAEAGMFAEIAEADTAIANAPWAVYRVRRIYFAAKGNPAVKAATAYRDVETVLTGTREEMTQLVAGRAGATTDRHGIVRKMIREATAPYPSAQEMFVAGPAGVRDKQRKGFTAAWEGVVHPQLSLLD